MQQAPDFRLATISGETVTRDAFRGHPLILAFFPLAFTGG
jgi:peroxiredoxin